MRSIIKRLNTSIEATLSFRSSMIVGLIYESYTDSKRCRVMELIPRSILAYFSNSFISLYTSIRHKSFIVLVPITPLQLTNLHIFLHSPTRHHSTLPSFSPNNRLSYTPPLPTALTFSLQRPALFPRRRKNRCDLGVAARNQAKTAKTPPRRPKNGSFFDVAVNNTRSNADDHFADDHPQPYLSARQRINCLSLISLDGYLSGRPCCIDLISCQTRFARAFLDTRVSS